VACTFFKKFPFGVLEELNVNKFHFFLKVEMQIDEKVPPAALGGIPAVSQTQGFCSFCT